MKRAGAAVLSALLSACSARPELGVELLFPDEASRAATDAILITAVEPFATAEDAAEGRRFVRCGEIGVFPPSVEFSRDATQLAGIDHVLLDREHHPYPLDSSWSLDLPDLQSDEDRNPWHAVLIHLEARGSAATYQQGLMPPEPETLLEGCFCVRLDPGASGPDEPLDAEVKAGCAAVSEQDSAIALHELVAPEFHLEAYGVTTLTAPDSGVFAAEPGFRVNATRCGGPAPPGNCYQCPNQACMKLRERRNAAIEIEVGGRSSIAITDNDGKAVPELPLAGCTDGRFAIRGSLVGRPAESVTLEVSCVPSVKLDERLPAQQLPDPGVRAQKVVGLSALPATRGDRLAVLTSAPALYLYEAGPAGLRLIPTATLALPGEDARAVLGFRQQDHPLLALITTVTSTAPHKIRRLRILSYDIGRARFDLLGSIIDGDCPICGCTTAPACEACSCGEETLRADATYSMTAADLDRDGAEDLAFGATTGDAMTTYFATGDPAAPFAAGACACSKFGKNLAAFELLRMGGPPRPGDPLLERQNVDFIAGDLTGAYVRYAAGPEPDGPPCDPADARCPAGTQCVEGCPGSARCLESCRVSPGRPTCRTLPAAPVCSTESGYCGAPALTCGAPAAVWPFVNVHHITRGRFGDGVLEDAVAVGSGSPVPGVEGEGKLRILFGGDLDLTANVPLEATFDLVPRAFAPRPPPTKPRRVQVGDFNGDGHDDLAVLFTGTEEIHVWLGAGNRSAGELDRGPILDCKAACAPGERCSTADRMAVADLDGDGRSEIVAVCVPDSPTGTARATLRWFAPAPM